MRHEVCFRLRTPEVAGQLGTRQEPVCDGIFLEDQDPARYLGSREEPPTPPVGCHADSKEVHPATFSLGGTGRRV